MKGNNMPNLTEEELDARLSTMGLPTGGSFEDKQKLWAKHSNISFEKPQESEPKVEHPNAVKELAKRASGYSPVDVKDGDVVTVDGTDHVLQEVKPAKPKLFGKKGKK